jgi:hypothetical protein
MEGRPAQEECDHHCHCNIQSPHEFQRRKQREYRRRKGRGKHYLGKWQEKSYKSYGPLARRFISVKYRLLLEPYQITEERGYALQAVY